MDHATRERKWADGATRLGARERAKMISARTTVAAALRRKFAPGKDKHAPDRAVRSGEQAFRVDCGGRPVSVDIFPVVFALLGPSGCGKTTLLRLLAGCKCRTADAFLDGNDLAGAGFATSVNMMFRHALFPHLSVENNVAFGLKQDGLPRQEIAIRVAEMLSLVDSKP
jgi:putrescine transport system ATP-binding protein